MHRHFSGMIIGMDRLEYAQILKKLHLYSFYGRLLHAEMIKCGKVFKSKVNVGLSEIIIHAPNIAMRDHSYKAYHPRSESDTDEIS